jgi:hypothetical protein
MIKIACFLAINELILFKRGDTFVIENWLYIFDIAAAVNDLSLPPFISKRILKSCTLVSGQKI